ncbi:MAG: hypothetical protein WC659_02975 [Patescibacteria group bacterium]
MKCYQCKKEIYSRDDLIIAERDYLGAASLLHTVLFYHKGCLAKQNNFLYNLIILDKNIVELTRQKFGRLFLVSVYLFIMIMIISFFSKDVFSKDFFQFIDKDLFPVILILFIMLFIILVILPYCVVKEIYKINKAIRFIKKLS